MPTSNDRDPLVKREALSRDENKDPFDHRARIALIKRLADVVSLPGSRVNHFERSMVADILVETLRDSREEERARVAQRIAYLSDIPQNLLLLLLCDKIAVATHLLRHAAIFDLDLVYCVEKTTLDHRLEIAQRRGLSEIVVDRLVAWNEKPVITALLRNIEARFCASSLESVMIFSQKCPEMTRLLLKRQELRPSHACVMFWWCAAQERKTILSRFAVSREVAQEVVADVFAMAAAQNWQDGVVRKALQFIERRQRNRAALLKSPFESLEAAIDSLEMNPRPETILEIGYLCGLKPVTTAKIFSDPGGEALAILCKATGLPRTALLKIWRGFKRSETDQNGQMAANLEQSLWIFDTMATDRAQTVLKYWNWALSSDFHSDASQNHEIIDVLDGQALILSSLPKKAAQFVLRPIS